MSEDHEFGRSGAPPSLASPSLDAGSATPSGDRTSIAIRVAIDLSVRHGRWMAGQEILNATIYTRALGRRLRSLLDGLEDDRIVGPLECGEGHGSFLIRIGNLRDLVREMDALEGIADLRASDGEVSKAPQALQTTEHKGDANA